MINVQIPTQNREDRAVVQDCMDEPVLGVFSPERGINIESARIVQTACGHLCKPGLGTY